MRLTFLGTGTSFGIPVIGCRCPVCTSDEPRNRRYRHGLLLREAERALLVDAPPELRLQLLAARVRRLDAVYITHPHADHIHGIDDLRAFTYGGRRLPVYLAAEYEREMRGRFPYFWGPEAVPAPGTTIPALDLLTFGDREPIEPGGFGLQPIAFPHGPLRSYGFRCGPLAVIVDAKRVPEDAWPLLDGAEAAVINALWFGSPHPTHFNVEEAVAVARRLGAARTFLTHLTHRLDHETLARRLPAGIEPAYDGLTVEL